MLDRETSIESGARVVRVLRDAIPATDSQVDDLALSERHVKTEAELARVLCYVAERGVDRRRWLLEIAVPLALSFRGSLRGSAGLVTTIAIASVIRAAPIDERASLTEAVLAIALARLAPGETGAFGIVASLGVPRADVIAALGRLEDALVTTGARDSESDAVVDLRVALSRDPEHLRAYEKRRRRGIRDGYVSRASLLGEAGDEDAWHALAHAPRPDTVQKRYDLDAYFANLADALESRAAHERILDRVEALMAPGSPVQGLDPFRTLAATDSPRASRLASRSLTAAATASFRSLRQGELEACWDLAQSASDVPSVVSTEPFAATDPAQLRDWSLDGTAPWDRLGLADLAGELAHASADVMKALDLLVLDPSHTIARSACVAMAKHDVGRLRECAAGWAKDADDRLRARAIRCAAFLDGPAPELEALRSDPSPRVRAYRRDATPGARRRVRADAEALATLVTWLREPAAVDRAVAWRPLHRSTAQYSSQLDRALRRRSLDPSVAPMARHWLAGEMLTWGQASRMLHEEPWASWQGEVRASRAEWIGMRGDRVPVDVLVCRRAGRTAFAHVTLVERGLVLDETDTEDGPVIALRDPLEPRPHLTMCTTDTVVVELGAERLTLRTRGVRGKLHDFACD